MRTISVAIDGYLGTPLDIAAGGLLSVTVTTDDSNLYTSPRRRLRTITDIDSQLLSRTVALYSIESTSTVSNVSLAIGITIDSVVNTALVSFVGAHQWSPESMSTNPIVIGSPGKQIILASQSQTKKKIVKQHGVVGSEKIVVKMIKKRKYNE